jgi:hypothetical protein
MASFEDRWNARFHYDYVFLNEASFALMTLGCSSFAAGVIFRRFQAAYDSRNTLKVFIWLGAQESLGGAGMDRSS